MLHNETRKLALEAYEKSHNAKEVARNYSVNECTIYRLAEKMKRTGSVELQTSKRGRKPLLTEQNINDIDQLIRNCPDITIDEIIDKLSLSVCNECVRMAVIKLGYRYKKKSLHAAERDRPRCESETHGMEVGHAGIRCK